MSIQMILMVEKLCLSYNFSIMWCPHQCCHTVLLRETLSICGNKPELYHSVLCTIVPTLHLSETNKVREVQIGHISCCLKLN